MKKIAILCSTDYNSYPVGGMMSFIKDAAPALSKHFEVDFWGVDAGAGVDSFTSDGRRFPVNFFGSVKIGRKIVPNMVRVSWLLWLNRKAVMAAGYDGIYIHGIPLNAVLPFNADGPRRINHVHGLNNPFKALGVRNSFTRRLLHRLYERLRRTAVRDSDLVLLAGDEKGLPLFQVAYPTTARLSVLPNFCDTKTFGGHVTPIDRGEEGVDQDDRILLYVGRLSKEKDPILAVNILSALRNHRGNSERVRLVIIGGGDLQQDVALEARRLGVAADVIMLGMQPRHKIAQWMRSADLLLLTSHFEGFPVVLAEAAQSGLPMVCPDITGVHDLVIPDETGFIVRSRCPNDFIDPILDVLANREVYGARAQEVATRFAPERILDRLCREIADAI